MTEIDQLKAAMTACDTAYVEKTGKQPYMETSLNLTQANKSWEARLWVDLQASEWIPAYGQTPDIAIARLRNKILALPPIEEQRMREFQRDLGKLIDKGRELDIPVEYVTPLAETAKRLAENALTYEAAE